MPFLFLGSQMLRSSRIDFSMPTPFSTDWIHTILLRIDYFGKVVTTTKGTM